jgi:hypothetical protein
MNTSRLSEEHSALLAALTSQIVTALPTWFGAHSKLVSDIPDVRHLKQSFFIRYAVRTYEGQPKTLLLKIPRKPDIKTLAQAISATHLAYPTQQEFNSLLTVAQTFQTINHGAFCQIRPFAYLPAWNAIVMEELPAKALKQLLLRPRMALGFAHDWQPLQVAMQRAGEWLRVFHEQLGEGVTAELSPAALQLELEQELAQLRQAAPKFITPAWLPPAFAQVITRIQLRSMSIVTLHGDFNCGNILVMPDGRVGAIDTKRRQRGSIYIDLATLATDPATRKLQVLSQGWFIRSAWLARCQQAVLQGYFGANAWDEALFRLHSVLAILRKWTLDEETLRATALAYGLKPLVRRYFTTLLRRQLTLPT